MNLYLLLKYSQMSTEHVRFFNRKLNYESRYIEKQESLRAKETWLEVLSYLLET